MTLSKHFMRSFILSALLLTTAPAFAQSDVQARMSRLENEIQTLSRAVFRGETPPPGAFAAPATNTESQAAFHLRITQVEDALRDLTGRLEEQQHQLATMQKMLDRELSAADDRARALEKKLEQNAATPPATPSDNQSVPPLRVYDETVPQGATLGTLSEDGEGTLKPTRGSPEELYENAFVMLKARHYPAARQGFERFLEQFSDHNLASNAKYWLGETFYVTNDFPQAARIFAEAYQTFPKSQKAPDSLLKLGMALAAQDQKDSACLSFNQIKLEYPTAEAVLTRAKQEMEKLGCIPS